MAKVRWGLIGATVIGREWMIDAIHERILPLGGHTPTTVQTTGDLARRARMGV